MAGAETFSLGHDEHIIIETYDVDVPRGVELVARGRAETASFSEAVDRALPAARLLVGKLEEVASNVKEIEVEFGLKFSGEVGALIARTGTEANFRVKLTWSPDGKAGG